MQHSLAQSGKLTVFITLGKSADLVCPVSYTRFGVGENPSGGAGNTSSEEYFQLPQAKQRHASLTVSINALHRSLKRDVKTSRHRSSGSKMGDRSRHSLSPKSPSLGPIPPTRALGMKSQLQAPTAWHPRPSYWPGSGEGPTDSDSPFYSPPPIVFTSASIVHPHPSLGRCAS